MSLSPLLYLQSVAKSLENHKFLLSLLNFDLLVLQTYQQLVELLNNTYEVCLRWICFHLRQKVVKKLFLLFLIPVSTVCDLLILVDQLLEINLVSRDDRALLFARFDSGLNQFHVVNKDVQFSSSILEFLLLHRLRHDLFVWRLR